MIALATLSFILNRDMAAAKQPDKGLDTFTL